MDRVITYVGQSVYEWLFSKQAQSSMVGMAKLASAMFGSNTIANGLSCVPTGPASLQVVINPGEIYQVANLEASTCGTLPADSTHTVMKQGILLDAFTTASGALNPPGTAGQSINYLIEAQYADSDVSLDPTTGASPVVLQFYNSTNPGSPWSGPGGLGGTSNTFRKGIVSLQVKAGTAATTGSQVTPSPDAGWVGLWVVTVANGQTQILAGNISQYSGALFLSASILAQIQAIPTTGRLLNVQRFLTSGSYTYTPTAGTNKIIVEVQGAGGGGGGSTATGSGQSSMGGGGGAGTYAKVYFTSGVTTTTGTIGTGGTAGAVAGAGGPGSASTFGTYISCPGGNAGGTLTSPISTITAQLGATAAAGPTITGLPAGSITLGGVAGAAGGYAIYGSGSVGAGAAGGNATLGNGGAPNSGVNPGSSPTTGSGGGGSGGCTFSGSGAGQVGGAGATGIVLVYEYA